MLDLFVSIFNYVTPKEYTINFEKGSLAETLAVSIVLHISATRKISGIRWIWKKSLCFIIQITAFPREQFLCHGTKKNSKR